MVPGSGNLNAASRILVTGGSGMVGSALRRLLNDKGYKNVIAPRSHEFDLRDPAAARRMFATGHFDCVFHLAGHIGGIGASIAAPVEFLHENAAIGMNVVHAAREACAGKLVYLSSSCAYPRDCPQPMREDYLLTGPLEPTNEGYAIAKIATMKLIEYSNRQYGTNFVTLMPCNLYGPGDHYEPVRSHAVSALIYKMHHAKTHGVPSVEVWGTGASRRELLYVDDLAGALLHFMQRVEAKDVDTFVNVGLGQDILIRELAGLIGQIVGFEGEIVFNPAKPDGMPRKLMDVSRAAGFGWRAQIGISEGLKRAYEWYVNNLEATKT